MLVITRLIINLCLPFTTSIITDFRGGSRAEGDGDGAGGAGGGAEGVPLPPSPGARALGKAARSPLICQPALLQGHSSQAGLPCTGWQARGRGVGSLSPVMSPCTRIPTCGGLSMRWPPPPSVPYSSIEKASERFASPAGFPLRDASPAAPAPGCLGTPRLLPRCLRE